MNGLSTTFLNVLHLADLYTLIRWSLFSLLPYIYSLCCQKGVMMSNLWCMRICEKRDSKMNNSVNERWILCDACEVWFHMACVKLNRAPRGIQLELHLILILIFSFNLAGYSYVYVAIATIVGYLFIHYSYSQLFSGFILKKSCCRLMIERYTYIGMMHANAWLQWCISLHDCMRACINYNSFNKPPLLLL